MNEKFLELAKYEEQLIEKLSQVRSELATIMGDLKDGTYVQDPETLVVYKIYKPNGKFVYFSDLDYKRTALDGERGGTILSKKEAQEAGFTLNN